MTNWSELGLFVSACAASLGGLFAATRHSRCTNIKTPCMSCERDLEPNNSSEDLESGLSPPVALHTLTKKLEQATQQGGQVPRKLPGMAPPPPAPTPMPKRVSELRKVYSGGST